MADDIARRPRVGVRDVAAAAGVSTQTVSRVINDHPHIRPETRARVEVAMAALGYRVNNAARALGTSTTRTIGVLASDTDLFGPAAAIAALETAARVAGRWIATAYAVGADPAEVAAAADRLLAQGVDGIVVVAPHRAALAALEGAAPGVPVTAMHTGRGAARQIEGAALAVDHLVALGHRRIARVAGPQDWLEAQARDAGVDDALRRHALLPAGRWHGDWSALSGAALAPAVVAALAAPDRPTAVAVANDQMALGLIAGLDARGVAVPRDLSVIGFDDHPDAAFYRPPLSTVSLDVAGEARRCVAELAGDQAEVAAAPRVIVRASTAPPRA